MAKGSEEETMRRTMRKVRGHLGLVTCLLVGAQGCAADGVSSSFDEQDGAATSEQIDKASTAELAKLETEELVRRAAALPNKKVFIFDFDDSLYDHVEGQSSRWASYAKSAITHLKQQNVNIAICSRNKNTTGALNKRLRQLDSQVFNDAFFASPAFQDNTGTDKLDDVKQIMAYYKVTREDHVVFYDDTQSNLDRVGGDSDVIAVPVHANGIDRGEFRDGLILLLAGAPGGGGGGTGGGNSGGTTSCKGQCSSACPCNEGQGDCDSSADCAGDLVCPADGPGAEVCMKPGSGGGSGGGSSGGSSGGGSSSGSGNLRVKVGSRWVSVGCASGAPRADGGSDRWQIVDRKLINQNGVYLFCDEGWADGRDCQCSRSSSEAYHAIAQADFTVAASARKYGNGLTTSLAGRGPMYIFPNNAHEFCLAVGSNNIIENKDGGDDGNHHESTHKGKCNEWCLGDGCP